MRVTRGAMVVMKGKLMKNNLYKLMGTSARNGASGEIKSGAQGSEHVSFKRNVGFA